jgi:cytochrome c peroxidase
VLLALTGIGLPGCTRAVSSKPTGKPITVAAPLGLPPVPVPANNPVTAEAIALGRKLFYDRNLSNQSTLSCASCHLPSHDFSDPRNVSLGFHGAHGTRNAPTVLNAAYLPYQFWDGRASSLEAQVIGPTFNPVEMDNTARGVVANLEKNPEYPALFQKAFGTPDITIERIQNAIASYERTLLSGNSAFDRYEYGGDKTALTPQQIRGLAIFRDTNRGNCAACHTIAAHYALLTDGKFHNIGEGVDDEGQFDDTGRFDQTHVASDTGAFETPTLRDIAETGPYMHDGKIKTLDAVVQYYAGQGNSNPNLDKEIKKIHLPAQDRSDLVAFLKSLTGNTSLDVKAAPEKAVHP